jgi:Kef-type K+ transport system membrane component KefB/nucleotide-binding universal stress UspA family protein
MNPIEFFLGGGHDPILLLLVQVGLVLTVSRVIGLVFARLDQPQVVGEMLAGIMLGPSLLGLIFPHAFAAIFPKTGGVYLNTLSQVGVICFLFLVGLELDPKLIRNRGHAAVVISHVSIVAPFLLGCTLTLGLYSRLFNHTPAMGFRSVALFMGAAMSITAFPVLARILTERNLHKTKVGAVAITCAAVDDVTAWCMLAVVIGIAKASAQSNGLTAGLYTALWAAIYVLVMFFVVRPFLRQLQQVYDRRQRLSQTMVGFIFVMVMASAYVTERIGIHALFGAFLLGAVMPKGTAFVRTLTEKLEDFTVVFLLPLFFAYSGLQTKIGVLNTPALWGYCGLIILVACAGKFGGSTLAARACGLPWREAGAIGILMNTRGLMELVILNVGRELGVITEAVFAMMVLMALVTTALTTPILNWVYPRRLMEAQQTVDITAGYKILIPVALPASGPRLVRLADALAGDDQERQVLALCLRRPVDQDRFRVAAITEESADKMPALQPLLAEAVSHGTPVKAISFVSRDVPSDIARTARLRGADLILMGFHNPVYTASILGGTVHRVLTGSDTDVAIYVDRRAYQPGDAAEAGDAAPPRTILVPFLGSKHDRLAMELAGRMARRAGTAVTVLHVVRPGDRSAGEAQTATDRVFNDPGHALPVVMRVVEADSPVDVVIEQAKDFDLVVIGVAEEWGLESHLLGFRAERVAREVTSSLLIVRKHGAFDGARGMPASDAPADAATGHVSTAVDETPSATP